MEDPRERSSGDSQSQSQSNAAVIVDIPSLAQALEQELARHRRQLGGSTPYCTPSIGTVEELTREVDPQEYDPHHVSIGPYHRRKRSPNVAGKLASLDAVLSAATPPANTVTAYLAELAADEARARSYYANTFDVDDMTSWEFLRMLLLDACYVLSWFVLERGNKQEMVAVVRDVFYLVENQIPYFILDKVHKLTFPGTGSGVVPVSEIIAEKLQYILQKQQYTMARIKPPPEEEPGNLLHLVHMHFLKPATTVTSVAAAISSSPTGGNQKRVGRWRTAMDYHISGVKLKSRPIVAADGGARCILDVTLDVGSGTLLVPCLSINSDTSGMLRNLVALEQQNPGVGSHVTAYCVFMSQIACTARDVELLSRRGVVVHLLGNHGEVADLFSDLCKGVLFDPDDADRNYLRATCQELDKWYGSRRRRWMALLWHKYFANPWLAIGVMAAAIGLVATLVQTVYTALSYYRSISSE